jgi:hypothetical protein
MVFHGDYEVEFEIYEKREDDGRSRFLGHMAGLNPDDAKARWVAAHAIPPDYDKKIEARFPYEEWR